MTPRSVIFNTYQMMNMSGGVGIMVSIPDHDGTQNLLTSEYHQTRGTGSIVTNQEFDAKPIVITGSIVGSTVDDMESRLDTFLQNVQGVSDVLALHYANGTRYYNATYKSCKIVRGGANVTKLDFTLTLTANSGLGYDGFTSSLNNVTFSGNNTSFPVTLSGSSPRQWLVLSGTLTTFSGSYVAMQFTNNQTGYLFSIQNRYWNPGDQFYIDFFNQICTVNGVAVPFTGSFWSMSPTTTQNPTTSWTYSDGFITRQINLSESYIRRWV